MNIDLQSLEARHPAALPGAPAALRALNLRFDAGSNRGKIALNKRPRGPVFTFDIRAHARFTCA